ncbi:MAG: endonuclease, partial [Aeromicrobium sp.]|nr:endonuclease [Aeromicrobium sp.]
MFEDAPIDSLLGQVLSYDFESLPVVETGFVRVEAIVALDRVMRAAQAEQATQVAALYDERVHRMGLGQGDPGLSVIGEVGMARNIGPTAAGTQLGLALGLKRLPKVFELFRSGVISELTARVVVNETCSLSVDDFPIADAALADKIPGLTTVRARQAAARVVIGIDAEAARVRASKARANAHVSMHPDADGMATLRVHGPAEQIVAAFNTLDFWARGLRATGDPRSRGTIMAETLVER